MRTVIVYETESPLAPVVARALADTGAFTTLGDVDVVPASGASDPDVLGAATFVVVGGATCSDEGTPEGPSLHEWFSRLRSTPGKPAAAFEVRRADDTAGRCGAGANRKLHQHHFHVVAPVGSFVVDESGALARDEAVRLNEWAEMVASGFAAVARKRREHQFR
jgi:hypothetical protein